MRKVKNTSCAFGFLLVCIFSYVQNSFPTVGIVTWDMSQIFVEQVNDLINRLGENFEAIIDNYFEEFKIKKRNKLGIPKSVINKYYDEICLVVDIDFVHAQVVIPRIEFLRSMHYEVNVDKFLATMIALLIKDDDTNAKKFCTYETMVVELTANCKIQCD